MVNHTKVFLPDDKFAEAMRLMEPTIQMDFETNINITKPGNKEAAWKLIDEFALSSGLPGLPEGHHYGLLSDRELVSPPL